MTEIMLPWPPKELSPNARIHWARLSKIKRKYREECWAITKSLKPIAITDEKLNLHLEFFKPTRRLMDRDNLLARMKAGLDGMSDALGIDDSRFDRILIEVSDQTGGYVKIKIFNNKETI